MCLNGEDDGLFRKAFVEIFLEVALIELLQLQGIVGIKVVAICRVEAIADVGDFAVLVGQNVCVGLVVRDGAIVEGVWLG